MAEAIRLGGILAALMPDEPEVLGLEALLLLQASRTRARAAPDGALVLLEDQDRALVGPRPDRARPGAPRPRARLRRSGPYQLQAAIAALHAQAERPEDTDWCEIALLYGELARLQPSPVVELNRAVAVAMAEGPAAGLELLDGLPLERYHLFHSARADLLRRAGRVDDARAAYVRASELATNESERAFLSRRLAELDPPPDGQRPGQSIQSVVEWWKGEEEEIGGGRGGEEEGKGMGKRRGGAGGARAERADRGSTCSVFF